MYQLIAFDAYGTLFDVYSMGELAETLFPVNGQVFAASWRDRQIEYTRLVTMSDPTPTGSRYYRSFWDVTRSALQFTAGRFSLEWDDDIEEELMSEYLKLAPFPECRDVLTSLQARGIPLSILSNGDPEILAPVIANAGFTDFFDSVISVAAVRRFKTADAAYQLGPDTLGIPASELLFVSANCWDAIAATWFGYQTMWINRTGFPLDPLGTDPTFTAPDLASVLTEVSE